MTTALVESPEKHGALAWLSVDSLVFGHGSAPDVDAVLLDMIQPARSVPPLCGDVQPERRPGSLVARWVPDPRGQLGLICTWAPPTRTEASASFDA